MKRLSYVLLCLSALFAGACSKENSDFSEIQGMYEDAAIDHGEIVLGNQLENPYTVQNVKSALASLYPTKASFDIDATHYYVRFLPQDEEQLEHLSAMGLVLIDHPVDYEIVREGDYYHDPDLDDDAITWQYAVVPVDFVFPDIQYERLDDCFIAEDSPATKAYPSVNWEEVEKEAFRLTGNGYMLADVSTKGEKVAPSGRITIIDDKANGGQPFGVSGVRVDCNVFIKISRTYCDRDGYYQFPKKFSANPRYRIVFRNDKGFSIGVNSILFPASVSTLGKHSPAGVDVCIDKNSDRKLFRRSVVNNAAWEYYNRCSVSDLGITAPHADLCIWTFDNMDCSSAIMLHHGTVLNGDYENMYLRLASIVIRFFAPDITLGTKGLESYSEIYAATVHELAHASHFRRVGTDYWNSYITYVVSAAISGQGVYGDGSLSNAGLCAVGEMWAYYLESKLYKERYGGSNPAFGSQYWFHPQILSQLEERGLEAADIFAAIKASVTDSEGLRVALMDLYPRMQTAINQVFNRYE